MPNSDIMVVLEGDLAKSLPRDVTHPAPLGLEKRVMMTTAVRDKIFYPGNQALGILIRTVML